MVGANSQRRLPKFEDVFGNQVSGRTNVLDLASHYRYTPQRWTLSVDGTRQLLQYNSVSQYNHAGDVHELKPAGGETVVLETADAPRYVVQYELASSWAFSLNQSLSSGDLLRIGLYDGSDGWYMEQDGTHADDEADFVTERNGTEVYRKSDINLHKDTQTFARLRLKTGWYDVTRQVWDRSFTADGDQRNSEVGAFSADSSRGPKRGNLPLRYEIQADSTTSGLQLNAGSCALVNLGTTVPINRLKTAVFTDTIDTTGSWVPLRAFRVKPGDDVVRVEVPDVGIGKYSVSADVELLLNAFDPSKVLDSGGNELVDGDFSIPNDLSDENSAIETATAVEQVADSSGTTSTSVSDPGGWQLGRSELFDDSGNSSSSKTTTRSIVKRQLLPRDIMVVLGKSGSTGDVSYQIDFEQDW